MGNGNVSARERLETEKTALKEAVYGFIRDGRPGAGQVLDAYARISPGDPDILHIKKMIDLAAGEEFSETAPGVTKLRDKLKLLSNTETVFILANTNLERNGAVNSVIRKVKLMEETWGYKSLILFCEHNIELRRIVKRLREDGGGRRIRLSASSRVLNVYDYFQGSYAPGLPNKAVFLGPSGPGAGLTRVQTGEDVYDVYEGGELLRREHYIGYAYCLRLVEFFKDGKRERGVYYDDWGYLNKVREYDSADETQYGAERFYGPGGRLRLEAFYRFAGNENQVCKVILYNERGEAEKECKDNAELAAACLDELTSDASKTYLLAVESGMMAEAAALVEKPNVARAAVVHSAFLEDSYALSGAPQPFYRYICENRDKFNAIVFPTRSERDDFCAKYGEAGNGFVIPHSYPYPPVRTEFEERGRMKAVIVARFDPIKRIGDAIEIFKLVVKELPGATLNIYGAGSQEGRYRELIKTLGLEGNVFIMGFTDDPAAVFAGAAVSLMTSAAEGFGLTLAESVCNGCPAIAFDIKYGPSDIIKEGETGFLIPRFDKRGFALKLTEYFTDEARQREMSENCYKDAARFAAGPFLERWYNMIYNIKSNI